MDRKLAWFHEALEASGLLSNTWAVLTSDHGEMFERGISAHSTDALYEPVIRIPLMIFEPGRGSAMDIHTPTSAGGHPADAGPCDRQAHSGLDGGRRAAAFCRGESGTQRLCGPGREERSSRADHGASTALVRANNKLYFFGFPEKGHR